MRALAVKDLVCRSQVTWGGSPEKLKSRVSWNPKEAVGEMDGNGCFTIMIWKHPIYSQPFEFLVSLEF